jgi:hypothetical protein
MAEHYNSWETNDREADPHREKEIQRQSALPIEINLFMKVMRWEALLCLQLVINFSLCTFSLNI